MKKVVLLFLVVFSASLYAQEVGIKFSKDSLLSDALAQAKKEGKLVFIDCYTTWCGPCKRLAKDIFPLKEVGDFYNSHFINLSFDMEKGEGLKIRKQYGVQAFPTLLFLNSNGEMMHLGLGSMPAEAFISLGNTALDDTKNLRSITVKMKAGDKIYFQLTDQLMAEQLFIKQQQHLQQLQNACTFRLQEYLAR